ncbi:phosphatase PAP2 family protein [Streptomonospora nanhaiensis]|uniref:Membrane-associated phospholipid phosphatase n=1 Tax=Streptomonospora nanhaiensis TaxID=1323731 RepID=A0A853BHL9_9ACTN|nr:phosphatase PAP2 family protein [Streptomonospora nanhaiensis]NYI94879.1 membrane-associated phospholipid phosphatase [Streptomonospora nanhaiensis]
MGAAPAGTLQALDLREVAMDAVWDTEIALVAWIQGWGTWLLAPMEAVSLLGSQALLVVFVPLLFWSVSAGLGARTYLVAAAGGVVNGLLKFALHGARPDWYHHGVRSLAPSHTFGAPSGHAQNSLMLWGYLALRLARRWAWYAAAAIVLAVALTRLYLGAHFLTDILLGWLVGAAMLWAVARNEDALRAWWLRLGLAAQVVLALAVSAGPVLLAQGWETLVHAGWSAPEDWTGAVPRGLGDGSVEHVARVAGGLFGGLAGFSVLAARGWYSAAGPLVSRVARYVIGLSGIVLLLVVMRVALPEAGGAAGAAVDFASFAVVALWSALGAPELFVLTGLARRPAPERAAEGPAARRE